MPQQNDYRLAQATDLSHQQRLMIAAFKDSIAYKKPGKYREWASPFLQAFRSLGSSSSMFPGFLSPTWLFLCLLALTAASPLVPFKNSPSLHARSTWKRAIVPKDVVSLHYSQLGATYASSSLTFPAHSNTPILLLEDIDFLVDSVVCSLDGSAVHISFTSDDSYAATLAAWSSLPQFMLITAHMGCNPHDQRAAWRVVGVVGADYTHKISLDVLPVPLREVGAGYKIRHNTESTTASWGAPQILRRDSEIDNITNFDYSIDFDPRQQLIPVNTNALGSNALTDSLKDLTPPGLEVFCTNCVSITKFALGVEVQVDDLLNIEEAYVNLTVTDFQQDIQLEISFNDTTNFEKDIDVMLVRLPDLSISLHDIVDIGFYWGGAVRMGLDIAHALNFTVGASATIPTGTSATLMLSNFSHSFASGWDKATFDVHPFRLNSGSLSATGNIALSPFLEATVDIFGGLLSPTGRLYVNTPRVNAVANLSTHVNRECNPLGPNDYEFFDNALTFGAELEITIDGTTTGVPFVNDTDSDIFSHSFSFSELPPLATPSCMVVVDDHTTSSLAGEVIAPTGTLLAAASAIPSFDVAGIQAYYSANKALPTGVNYGQMLQATTVPDDIKKAVQKAGANSRYIMMGAFSAALSMAVGYATVLL